VRADVVDLLAEYKSIGGTILFSSHVLHDVERLADQVIFLHQGEVKQNFKLETFLSDEQQEYSVNYSLREPMEGSLIKYRDIYSIQVPAQSLSDVIAKVLEGKGQIFEVKRANSLEQAFLKMIKS